MRVWIVCLGEPLPVNDTVRTRRMGILADFLSNNGVDVTWFSGSFDHYDKRQLVENDRVISLKANYRLNIIYTAGYKKNISLERIACNYDASKKIYAMMQTQEQPDVIIACLAPIELSEYVAQYATDRGVPFVIDIRDMWPQTYYDVLPRALRFLIYPYVEYHKWILKRTLAEADGIVGISQAALEYGLKLAGKKQSEFNCVIPIMYPNYNYKKGLVHTTKFGCQADDYMVVCTGNLGAQYDYTAIIEASEYLCDRYPRIKFVLCGTGTQEERLRAKARNNIVLTGWIDKYTIVELLANARLGIAPYIDVPNYRTNTPNKFPEYLSAGLPILVGVPGVMEDYLTKNECGCRYSNGVELAQMIINYYENEALRTMHSNNARKLYEHGFSENILCSRFMEYLQQFKR